MGFIMKTPEEKIAFRSQVEAAGSGVSIMFGLWLIIEGFKYNNPDLVKGGIALVSLGAGGALKSWHDFEFSKSVREFPFELDDPEQLKVFRRDLRRAKYDDVGTKIPLDKPDIL